MVPVAVASPSGAWAAWTMTMMITSVFPLSSLILLEHFMGGGRGGRGGPKEEVDNKRYYELLGVKSDA